MGHRDDGVEQVVVGRPRQEPETNERSILRRSTGSWRRYPIDE